MATKPKIRGGHKRLTVANRTSQNSNVPPRMFDFFRKDGDVERDGIVFRTKATMEDAIQWRFIEIMLSREFQACMQADEKAFTEAITKP